MTQLHPATIAETGPLILFDGVCNLCSMSVQFLASRDRTASLWYAAVQSKTGQSVLTRHGLPTDDFDSFVFLDDGRIFLKSAAFFRVCRHMRFPWPLMRIGLLVPRRIADWLYDRVAKNRYEIFGRRATCMVPNTEINTRFLT